MSDSITALNNYLQDRKESRSLSWAETSSGLSNEAIWTVHCKSEVKGTGVASQKATAKQMAAKQALQNLKAE